MTIRTVLVTAVALLASVCLLVAGAGTATAATHKRPTCKSAAKRHYGAKRCAKAQHRKARGHKHKHKPKHKPKRPARRKAPARPSQRVPPGCCAGRGPDMAAEQQQQGSQPNSGLPLPLPGASLLGSVPGPPSSLFSPGSVWNVPLSGDLQPDPSSPGRIGALLAEIRTEIANRTGPWIAERSYSTPIYTVPANQPLVRVRLDAGTWAADLQRALDAGVPIAPDARPAAGTDKHLTIYQPSKDRLWEFWGAQRRADGWHALWGGAMQNVSSSRGYYTSAAWPGLKGSQGYNWGSTATSLPVVGGTIRIEELRHGRIDHALAVDIPEACSRTFTWPAQRTDGGLGAALCMPAGARLRLDPKLNIAALNLPPITRVLAEAAQQYGMIVRDTTHSNVGFFAEDPTPTGSDPYYGPNGFYGGLKPWEFLPKFPWANLQLLPLKLCAAPPCER
jgi:hypothetical protein